MHHLDLTRRRLIPGHSALRRGRAGGSLSRKRPRRKSPYVVSRAKNPWKEYSAAYLAAVGVFYCPSTPEVMKRGLSRIGRAFLELKAAGKVTTTNPKKMTFEDALAFWLG